MYCNNSRQFTQPLSINEILDELDIPKVDYYRALLIWKDGKLGVDLKIKSSSWFVNNHFDV